MLERSLKLFIFCLMVLLAFLVALQVFSRYVLNNPTSWSEEAANFTQVFMVFIGGSLAILKKQTLRITFLVDRLPPRLVIYIDFIMRILIVLFLFTMIYYSFFVIVRLHNQFTSGLGMSKSIVYISVPLGGILLLIATIRELHENYLRWRSMTKSQKTLE
jgi:TRAP-type C4-dicarboxylate transport system permease small subunit